MTYGVSVPASERHFFLHYPSLFFHYLHPSVLGDTFMHFLPFFSAVKIKLCVCPRGTFICSETTNTGGVKTKLDFWNFKTLRRVFTPRHENFDSKPHPFPQYLTSFPHIFYVHPKYDVHWYKHRWGRNIGGVKKTPEG